MIKISTNIHDDFTATDKAEIVKLHKKFKKLKLYKYVEKKIGIPNVAKFILEGLELENILEDVSLWEALIKLCISLLNIAKKRRDVNISAQMWIRNISTKTPTSIAFTITDDKKVEDLMSGLHSLLSTLTPKTRKGQIVWIFYDEIQSKWITRVF